MWKKIVLSVWMCLAGVAVAQADGKSDAVIRALGEKLAAYRSYEIRFEVSVPGQFSGVEGRFVVSGDHYYAEVNGSEVFFDGKVKYTYNEDDNEVLVESPDLNDNSVLSNPARFFKLYKNDFDNAYKGESTVGGKKVEQIVLTPKTAKAGYKSILLNVDPTTGMPLSIRYEVEGAPAADIRVVQITPNVPVTDATFRFDRRKYKDVEVIDFR